MSIGSRYEVNAEEYYAAGRFRCPVCAASSVVSADDMAIRGSDFLFDQCEVCGAVVLIDNSDITLARGVVGFEGFTDVVAAQVRAMELLEQQKKDRS